MSIIRAAVKLIIQQHAATPFHGRALTLGVPEAHATEQDVRTLFDHYAAGTIPHEPAYSTLTTNPIGQKRRFLSGRSFLRCFGFSAVDSLDIPGCEHPPEILHDLNDPIPQSLCNQYDFVMDPGTLEHVFDQRTCLTNIARFLRIGGTVCHLVPIYSYNGGYYSINPNVLTDFYSQNGFEKPKATIIMWDRYWAYSKRKTLCYRYDAAIMGSRHAIGDADQVRYTPHLLLFATKLDSRQTYVSPLQFEGNYVAEASMSGATRTLSLERRGKKIAKFAFSILPFDLAYYLQAFAYRHLSLLRARRAASFRI